MKEPDKWNDVLKKGDRVVLDLNQSGSHPRVAGRRQVMIIYERINDARELTKVTDEVSETRRDQHGHVHAAQVQMQHTLIMNQLWRSLRWRHLPGRWILWGPAMPFFALASVSRGMGGYVIAHVGSSLGQWLQSKVTWPSCQPELRRIVDVDGNELNLDLAIDYRSGYVPRPVRFEYVMV